MENVSKYKAEERSLQMRRLQYTPMSSRRLVPRLHLIFAMIISACGLLMACGPGRTAIDTRRRSDPLQQKERVPDVEETSNEASGPYNGVVIRGSDEFKALSENYDPDIVFKDEKKNGDERRMTKNCKEKLDALAKAVKAKWGSKGSGKVVKLKVISAYDTAEKRRHHTAHSLHHEGRAVDLATDDRDKRKLGELGQMAYKAGFDWVNYASKSYIHASVKIDGAEEEGSCFPETSLVRLEGGRTKSMKDLQVGDKVASMDSSGKLVYSKVVTFLDINPNKPTKYVSIQTENPAAQVTITGSHLIYQLNRTTRQKSTVHARDLKVDDFVYVQNGSALGKFTVGRIVSVMRTQNLGAYAPLTETGTIVVDNVLCSCYAVISDAKLAHWSFAPLRFAEWLFPGCSAHDEPGIHWYARFLYKVYTSWNYVQEKFS